MAKGDYILFNNVPFRSVTSHPRRYGVMFNPSSSRSRLRIIDAGKRYEFRLQSDGTVEYSIDKGANWHTITPLKTRALTNSFLRSSRTMNCGWAKRSVIMTSTLISRRKLKQRFAAFVLRTGTSNSAPVFGSKTLLATAA